MTRSCSIAMAIMICAPLLYFGLASPTQEALKSCAKNSNYTIEQCKILLER